MCGGVLVNKGMGGGSANVSLTQDCKVGVLFEPKTLCLEFWLNQGLHDIVVLVRQKTVQVYTGL